MSGFRFPIGGVERGTTDRGALFSKCEKYRYALWRKWTDGSETAVFVGLNPSTADEQKDDPTIRRCVGFAKEWGCSSLLMVNLFAWRATDPEAMKAADDPVGPYNDVILGGAAAVAFHLVAAWGIHGIYRDRCWHVLADLRGRGHLLGCLGETQTGFPRHPLYVKSLTPLRTYERTC